MPTHADYSTFAFLLQGYNASDQAIKSTDSNVRYYGFVDAFGKWYIQEETTSDNENTFAWRYDKGDDNFATAWSARESGTYQQYDVEYQ